MMKLTPQTLEKLRTLLVQNPLQEGELRRIKGMGELYVSNSDIAPDSPEGFEYVFLYSLRIGEGAYHFYGKVINE